MLYNRFQLRYQFFPDPANFSASDRPGAEFPKVWESPEKIKNLKLMKMSQNRKRAKTRCHTRFFAFLILDLKIVPSDAELNSAPGNQTHFSNKKVVVVPRKAAKLEKVVHN